MKSASQASTLNHFLKDKNTLLNKPHSLPHCRRYQMPMSHIPKRKLLVLSSRVDYESSLFGPWLQFACQSQCSVAHGSHFSIFLSNTDLFIPKPQIMQYLMDSPLTGSWERERLTTWPKHGGKMKFALKKELNGTTLRLKFPVEQQLQSNPNLAAKGNWISAICLSL